MESEPELMQFPMVRAVNFRFTERYQMALHCITLIRRLLAARDLTTFTIIADFYTVELILYRNMCSHFETGILFVGTR